MTSHPTIFRSNGNTTIDVKGCWFRLKLGPATLSREGSLSCHTYSDIGPRVLRSLSIARSSLVGFFFSGKQGVLSTYINNLLVCHLYGDVTITSERLQFWAFVWRFRSLGLCAGRGLYRVTPAVTWGPRFLRSHLKDRPIYSRLVRRIRSTE